jgi:hypothetical protein
MRVVMLAQNWLIVSCQQERGACGAYNDRVSSGKKTRNDFGWVMELEESWMAADSVNVAKESPLNMRDWVLQIQELRVLVNGVLIENESVADRFT